MFYDRAVKKFWHKSDDNCGNRLDKKRGHNGWWETLERSPQRGQQFLCWGIAGAHFIYENSTSKDEAIWLNSLIIRAMASYEPWLAGWHIICFLLIPSNYVQDLEPDWIEFFEKFFKKILLEHIL